MPAAARIGDNIKQDSPHCHAPIHPPAPVPTPSSHPALPLALVAPGVATVMVGGKPASVVNDISVICSLASCVPNGPGMVAMGSTTVMIGGLPSARVDDMTSHTGCVAPIPSPVGKVQSPGEPTVMIGG